MIPAGRRDKRIVIEQDNGITTDSHGAPIAQWEALHGFMARVEMGSGAERRQAASEGGSQTASFIVMRSARSEAITIAHRIAYDGAAWDIQQVTHLDRRETEIVAERTA